VSQILNRTADRCDRDRAESGTTEPDILDDLDEMWPILAGAEGGRIYQPGEIAAVMLLCGACLTPGNGSRGSSIVASAT
jgi:hypothetical protein